MWQRRAPHSHCLTGVERRTSHAETYACADPSPPTLALTPNLTLALALIADPRQVLFC